MKGVTNSAIKDVSQCPVHKGGDGHTNLNTTSDSNTNSEINLILRRNSHSRDVLRSISHNRENNQSDKRLSERGMRSNIVDTSNHELGAHGNQTRRNEQKNHSRRT
jgi:hypothetical protein